MAIKQDFGSPIYAIPCSIAMVKRKRKNLV
jgi:hypothetical protein